jgi:hypothetical protein
MKKEKKDADTIFRLKSWLNGQKQKNIQELDDNRSNYIFFLCEKTNS